MMPSINFVLNPEMTSKQNDQLGKPFPKRHCWLPILYRLRQSFPNVFNITIVSIMLNLATRVRFENTTGTAVVKGLVDFGYKN